MDIKKGCKKPKQLGYYKVECDHGKLLDKRKSEVYIFDDVDLVVARRKALLCAIGLRHSRQWDDPRMTKLFPEKHRNPIVFSVDVTFCSEFYEEKCILGDAGIGNIYEELDSEAKMFVKEKLIDKRQLTTVFVNLEDETDYEIKKSGAIAPKFEYEEWNALPYDLETILMMPC